jgi:hypothetical protein
LPLKIMRLRSSETPEITHPTTRRYVTEDVEPEKQLSSNLKPREMCSDCACSRIAIVKCTQ